MQKLGAVLSTPPFLLLQKLMMMRVINMLAGRLTVYTIQFNFNSLILSSCTAHTVINWKVNDENWHTSFKQACQRWKLASKLKIGLLTMKTIANKFQAVLSVLKTGKFSQKNVAKQKAAVFLYQMKRRFYGNFPGFRNCHFLCQVYIGQFGAIPSATGNKIQI